jgi:hypothetical protein
MFANKGIRPCMACIIILQTICFSSSITFAANDGQATSELVNPGENAKKYQVETEKGLFTVEISIQNDFAVGMNKFDMIIRDRDGQNVEDARILIVPWMSEHVHSISAQPVVTDKSGGVYHVENVHMNMKGKWEIRIRIIKGGVQDKVVLELPDVD